MENESLAILKLAEWIVEEAIITKTDAIPQIELREIIYMKYLELLEIIMLKKEDSLGKECKDTVNEDIMTWLEDHRFRVYDFLMTDITNKEDIPM